MGVEVAALGHAIEESPQRRPVSPRLFESCGRDGGVELAEEKSETQEPDEGRQQDEGKDDR
jgi:hypothetical protein